MVNVIPTTKTAASAANVEPSVFVSLFILGTSYGCSRRQAIAAHDLRQLGSVRWAATRRVDYLSRLTEILWTDRSWRDHAEHFHVMDSVVIEAVDGATRNAECLSRPDVDWPSVNSPGQRSVYAVDRLLVMVMAVGGSC